MSSLHQAERIPPAPKVIFLRYVAFAVVAGLANLGTQELAFQALGRSQLIIPILAGTAVGFIVKYALDKRWIFEDQFEGHSAEARKIFVYGLFSVATTALFWGTELAAWTIWRTPEAKYAGAVIGLALGNWIKYRLDKHFVFKRGRA
ncbi:GtrA family protein [Chthonobacter rhizosphaerae]|uniref:GtrA family protein n=1 Tax=Chthonobacter rhizosphaerae TaxID=2735553 RepID=UPI0015EEA1F8|nr:GtrA family protein [Chthonobacter rhizosphaerae]